MAGCCDNLKSPSLISGTWAGMIQRLASVGLQIGAPVYDFSMWLGFLLAWWLAFEREHLKNKHSKKTR